ncbi:hypothetical protein L202_08182 [Cryptococcus amylolentus CBS 6039]|uniref:Uncharacterized protein n=2 Tax=Cryptococcus amylolentus TaxID=104669 RepID=A0A1E3H9D4_9TREE|nr:hypothetical protein L202_08182 [Cryptococcus amylolentus CBS 6039]ODN72745.1 hypothetical protein L202_08182 [Cryptococcus amylolentus CBS 6039]ODN97950.1 hypothetical protein I350_07587 [Cryptococcus amylolentus CBS 6273]
MSASDVTHDPDFKKAGESYFHNDKRYIWCTVCHCGIACGNSLSDFHYRQHVNVFKSGCRDNEKRKAAWKRKRPRQLGEETRRPGKDAQQRVFRSWFNVPKPGCAEKGAEVSNEAASASQNPPTALPLSFTSASGAPAAPSVEEGRPTVIPQVGEKRRRDDVEIAEIGVDNGGEEDVGGDRVGNTRKASKHSPVPPDLDRAPQPSSSPSLTNNTPPVSEHEQRHRKESERGADVDPLHLLSEPVQAVKAL